MALTFANLVFTFLAVTGGIVWSVIAGLLGIALFSWIAVYFDINVD